MSDHDQAVVAPAASAEEFAKSVRAGLLKAGQKELDSKYLYDEVGSALFEVITVLPEYGLSRAGERLLRRYSEDLAARIAPPVVVAELGSGSCRKTRCLLEALSKLHVTTYCPIEISPAALTGCKRELVPLQDVQVVGYEKEYLDGLQHVAAGRTERERLLVLFLGSTIGNFSRDDAVVFLRAVRSLLAPGDVLLLATDLEKPAHRLLDAYDDPLGVTAAFNLNLLARINRELGGDFVLRQFRHEVRYNTVNRRIEMYLISLIPQTVCVEKADLQVAFKAGESIWTENSHKYTTTEVIGMAEQSGYTCSVQYVDEEWPFAHSLLTAV